MKKKIAILTVAAAMAAATGIAAFTIPPSQPPAPTPSPTPTSYAGYGADLEQAGHVRPYGLGYALDLEQTGHITTPPRWVTDSPGEPEPLSATPWHPYADPNRPTAEPAGPPPTPTNPPPRRRWINPPSAMPTFAPVQIATLTPTRDLSRIPTPRPMPSPPPTSPPPAMPTYRP